MSRVRAEEPHAAHPTSGASRDSDDGWAAACTSRLVRGDRSAFESLFLRRHAFVEAEAARRLGRRRDLVDDVTQESWLRIARGPRACAAGPALDAWLRRVVRSAAIDLLRSDLARRLRERRVAAGRREAAELVADHDLLEELRRESASLEGLGDEDRALLELRARTDATVAQIARWLGLGTAAVDSRLRRAVERARAGRNDA